MKESVGQKGLEFAPLDIKSYRALIIKRQCYLLLTLQSSLENRLEIPKIDLNTYGTFMYKTTEIVNTKGEMDKSAIPMGEFNITL